MWPSICQQICKVQQCPQNRKRSVFIPIPKKGNAKECSNCHKVALIARASKVMLKILQPRLQQYMNQEFPDVQAEFQKGGGTRDQTGWIIIKLVAFFGLWRKQGNSRKTSASASLTTLRPLCGSQQTVENY